ncbi:MAG: hypothetical protein AB7E73_13765 [Burkholderiales bacterium]
MTYRYRVYYEFNGPTKADPLRTQKNQKQIADALDRVSFELPVYFDDDEAKITTIPESTNAIVLTVETTQTDELFSQALTKRLRGLDLFASKLA